MLSLHFPLLAELAENRLDLRPHERLRKKWVPKIVKDSKRHGFYFERSIDATNVCNDTADRPNVFPSPFQKHRQRVEPMHEYTAIYLNVIGDKLRLVLVKLLEKPTQSVSIKIVGMQKTFTAFWYDDLVVLIDNEVIASVVSYRCFNGLNGEFFQCFHLPTPLKVHDAHDNDNQNNRDAYTDLNEIIHVAVNY